MTHEEYPELVEDVALFSVEAEMSSLGSMLRSDRAFAEMATTLAPKDFQKPAHRLIFGAMQALHAGAKPLDHLTLVQELRDRGTLEAVGGPDYLLEIDLTVPSAANAPFYGEIVRDKSGRRSLLRILAEIADAVRKNKPMAEIAEMVTGIPSRVSLLQRPEPEKTWAQMVRDKSTRPSPGGVRTGNAELDALMPYGGLTNGQITLVMAPTGEGKTTWMLGVLFEALDRGLRCALLTFADNSVDDTIERAIRWKCGMANEAEARERADTLAQGGYAAEAESVMRRYREAEEAVYGWDFEVYHASRIDEGAYYETAREWLARKVAEGMDRKGPGGVAPAPKRLSLAGWDYGQTIEVSDPVASRMNHYGQQAWLARRMEKLCDHLAFPFLVCVQMTKGEKGEEWVEGCRVWEKVCELHLRVRDTALEIKKRRRGGKTAIQPRHRHDDERWAFVTEGL